MLKLVLQSLFLMQGVLFVNVRTVAATVKRIRIHCREVCEGLGSEKTPENR